MLLRQVVATSADVTATRSRKEKVRLLAEVLDGVRSAERPLVARYLAGGIRQRRTGLGWRSLQTLPAPAESATLGVAEVDAAFAEMATLTGAGSAGRRRQLSEALWRRATAAEQQWLRAAVTGEVRQGASEAVLTEAVAAAAGVPLAAVRRAAMLAGGTSHVVDAAFAGSEALAAVGLTVGRPVQPMLAASAPDVATALAKVGGDAGLDAKLDGIRIQVHRTGDRVLVATRSLEDITARLPEVVEIVRSLPADRLVLDGEALALDAEGRARPFQETASRTASGSGADLAAVTPYFFDLLHRDGRDLIDLPAHERWTELDSVVPEQWRVTRWRGSDPDAAQSFAEEVLARGHEGVVVKAPSATYDAGRRGAGWVKVKPVHTLDLVVLAVEWGSGRRRGWLSNIHLGARDPDGGFVMLGKTFKGMTDEMLAWQTERFQELATSHEGHVVRVRPEQVVEIAFDGLQRSTRYPGGLALRFARVVRYRTDKSAADADTIDTVRGLLT